MEIKDSHFNEVSQHDLPQYLEEIDESLKKDYSQISRRVKEDPGTAGDQVEETWAAVLRKWLPSHYHVVTKGRVIGSTGEASPQIDVLVLWPSYPPFLLQKKLYMASGIAAAFECKLTLRKRHFKKLIETAVKLSRITEKEHTNRKNIKKHRGLNYAYEEYHRVFEFGLLAHSFEGDSDVAIPLFNNEIKTLDLELINHPNQMVDLICIRDLGSWVSEREAIYSQPVINRTSKTYSMKYLQFPYTNYHCLTEKSWSKDSSIHSNFSPLGSFLSRLYLKLSRVDSSLIPLSSFFTTTLSTGQGGGGGGRPWPELKTPDDLWDLSANQRKNNSAHLDGYTFLGF